MGMGYAPTHGWVISTAELKKIIPDEIAALEAAVETYQDGEFNGLAGYAQYETNGGNLIPTIADAVEVVCKAFAAKTKVGNNDQYFGLFYRYFGLFYRGRKPSSELSLYLCHYDEESGDRYDEMEDGEYWEVGGMEVLSPAGEALRKAADVDDKCWTHFG